MVSSPHRDAAAGHVLLRTTHAPGPDTTTAERFCAVSGNTGNLLFEAALESQLGDIQVVTGTDDLPQEIDCLVMTMSNIISNVCDMSDIVDAIERRRVRQIALVGIGAQAYDWSDKITLRPGTDRFLRLAAERGVAIGVRGYYTAELLASWTIHNVEVIGCPSAFLPHNAVKPVAASTLPWSPNVAVHATPHGHFRDKVSMLLAHGQRHGADFILQSEDWLVPLLGNPDADSDELSHLLYFAAPHMSHRVLRDWIARQGRIFYDATAFREGMAVYDFVYGMRFHGNMAAIQAGIPALNLVFDSRTRELCEFMHLPSIDIDTMTGDFRLEELHALADFSLYNATHPAKLNNYVAFLDSCGLPHVFGTPNRLAVAGQQGLAERVRLASIRGMLDDIGVSGCPDGQIEREVLARLRSFRSQADREAVDSGSFRPSMQAS